MSWALNYLNHFLLTHLLLDALRCAAEQNGEARVVEVTSSIYRMSPRAFDRLQKREGYNGVLAYAQSKRALILFAVELARRMQDSGVTINAVTPGLVRTDIASGNGLFYSGLMGLINRFALPLEKGIRPILRLAASPEMRGVSGRYFYQFEQPPLPHSTVDPLACRKLWQMSEAMLGMENTY
jgi:NAD(P)-dependent dehydrogenase (short-subunit alcohol dehydrogenase family)